MRSLAAVLLLCIASLAHAQYPQRAVRMVVPFFAPAGAEPVGRTAEAFAETVRVETEKWARVIKAANVKVQ